MPEWASSYINYKVLKNAVEAAKARKDVDLAGSVPGFCTGVSCSTNKHLKSSSSRSIVTSKMSMLSTTQNSRNPLDDSSS